MNLYDKISNAECKIPESFDLKISQAKELLHNADMHDGLDLVYIAFKFGYMQGKRAEQACKTNKTSGNRAESETERLRRHICEMASQIRSERRLRRIFNIVHANFLDDGLEGVNERSD